MNIRLEYSNVTGQFNCANAMDMIDIQNGYCTISCLMSRSRAERFIGYLHLRYPALRLTTGNHFLPVKKVKIELLQFIREDLLQLEKDMDKTFVRRASLH